jgi:Tol biopolymer transport system component
MGAARASGFSMALAAGARLGSYDIVALLGVGGMGEVYRARDTKLGRDVALKVLPEAFTLDPERLARFKREAQVLASLNHPNIAHIYGFEDSGVVHALVLELVEGPTLAERIAKGPLPAEEAWPIARQIAEALEAAHEQGIIHRDLKPANIKLRPDGTVKILDFGLAKALEPMSAVAGAGVTASPTITSPAVMSGVGVLLGTAAYMSPEQARGKPADKRADIWSFGCVVYEILTGRRAFDGDDISTTLAAVLKTDPDWSTLPPATPPSLRHLLGRCLRKDARERLRDIGEARIAIDGVLSGAVDESGPSASVRASRWRRLAIPAATVLVTSLATAGIVSFVARSRVAPPRVSRFQITPPVGAALSMDGIQRDVAFTPDGSRLVYISENGLFVRPLDRLDATSLVRGRFEDPFVSPDGQWVGFFEGARTLKKVAITGGPAMLVAQLDANERGATWMTDGTIIFATSAAGTGLQRIGADGGEPVVLTWPDRARGEANHWWPESLPDGQGLLYTVRATTGAVDALSIAVVDLRTGRPRILLRGGSHAQYVSSGHLVYAAAGTLRAVAFDLTRSSVIGATSPVVPEVVTTQAGAVEAALARDGTLVYVLGNAEGGAARTLVWVDRQGRETPIAAPPRAYAFPRISPDGTRIAVTSLDQNTDIWIWDLGHATLTRVTSDPAIDRNPVWTPDGGHVVFSSDREGAFGLFRQRADGTGDPERLATVSSSLPLPSDVSPDGKWLVFAQLFPKTGPDLMTMRLDGTHQVLALVQTPSIEWQGVVSPDGRWLAYTADDSGTFEVYVRPFPAVNSGHWQVSTSGGRQPLWARSGQELFYVTLDGALMRVAVETGAVWTAGAPTKVLEARYVMSPGNIVGRNYDIAADGQRLLMLKADGSDAIGSPPQIIVVQHFDEELKRLVPTK